MNSEDSKVNNLDLNEDGKIDYVRVIDNIEGDVHAIILQVPVSDKESQDIAVIEIEKQGDENAILQIVGNEDVYGEQVIAEPFDEEKVKSDKEKGPAPQFAPVRVVVNVWLWPSVRFMYRPGYAVWVSHTAGAFTQPGGDHGAPTLSIVSMYMPDLTAHIAMWCTPIA